MSSSGMQGWALMLSAYDYTIEHRSGIKNSNADALCRLSMQNTVDKSEVKIPGDVVFVLDHLNQQTTTTAAQIQHHTRRGPTIAKVEKLSCASGKVIILVNFNIIVWDTSGFEHKPFVDIPETFNLVQHIDKPTHNSGHLLDYIITRNDSSGVSNLYVSDFYLICDHRA